MPTPSYLNFNHAAYTWKARINYKENPEAYRVGKGEQGVLICEPYKSIIGPHWRFKTPQIALTSCRRIYEIFLDIVKDKDFVGADLARKYLQMGFTRASRYANYKSGVKYNADNDYKPMPRQVPDQEKVMSADIFRKAWKKAESNAWYAKAKNRWKEKYG